VFRSGQRALVRSGGRRLTGPELAKSGRSSDDPGGERPGPSFAISGFQEQPMKTIRVNACIVGGGPAGMMLGLLLAKRGADVLVLEGHENFDREYRGEVLQPSTARLLDELGLLEYMLAHPHSLLDTGEVRLNGEKVGEFSFKLIAPQYPQAIWMPQSVFLAALRRKAEPFPSFKCWMGAHATNLVYAGDAVAGVRGVQHGDEPFEVQADVVVAADGRYSTVAKLAGFKAEYHHHDFDLIWFSIPKPAGWTNTLYVALGNEVRGLMLPKYPHHVQVGIALRPGEWRQWRAEGLATVAARIRRFDPAFKEFADGLRDFTPFFPLEGVVRLVDDWARHGLLLIGDAAHTMSPAGAIGVNVAVATAAVAAQVLYPRLGRGPISRTELQAVQRLREEDVRTLHRLQLGAHKMMLSQWGRTRLSRRVLPKVMRLMLHSPLLPRIQRRIFFGVPLPPLDPAFRFDNLDPAPAEAMHEAAPCAAGGRR
jgi:2-polyprenyl-6-methoxyphenol hydroxylase-like FAD-dependent oxidoreductase